MSEAEPDTASGWDVLEAAEDDWQRLDFRLHFEDDPQTVGEGFLTLLNGLQQYEARETDREPTYTESTAALEDEDGWITFPVKRPLIENAIAAKRRGRPVAGDSQIEHIVGMQTRGEYPPPKKNPKAGIGAEPPTISRELATQAVEGFTTLLTELPANRVTLHHEATLE